MMKTSKGRNSSSQEKIGNGASDSTNHTKSPANNKGRKKSNIEEPVVQNNVKKPVENNFPPSTSTQSLRRSRRSCVLQKRSLRFCDFSSEDEIADDSDEDFTIDLI
ncbi:hypothetical protein TNCV_3346201 [Trichonephila clavipes]|nr:hypothetical protein TNCV_3346201 [Trichonephila clavipes]